MRSLPDRFESKVTALEENSGYKDMTLSEVIGKLLAYESRKAPSHTSPIKQKGIALKASNEEREEKNDSDEDLALFVKMFKKVVKFGRKDFRSKGHFAPECANHLVKKKGKVMAATWSGSSDDSMEGEESSDDEVANFIAFVSSHESKSKGEEEEESQEENDSSENGTSTQSASGYVEREVLIEHYAEFKSLKKRTSKKIKMLRVEILELTSLNDHLSKQVESSEKI
ncbi:hypothetical protein LWI28_018909 [Acer negundo]|uniref:Uncharacterized protein n=1 Tax=Acer negundo TaxID=4023 RepID=A0AAD5IJ07_ACENE|nr:hypothetical protein LWI28_018909 [Acer negundo]